MIDQSNYYVYITTSQRNGTLYIGVTNDLSKRMQQHKSSTISGFVTKYKITRLVYFEIFESVIAAIKREKQLKHWNRLWKLLLIEGLNPEWKDLSEQSLNDTENHESLDPRLREDDVRGGQAF